MNKLCLVIASASLSLILSACSTQEGKYYQHDGPPSSDHGLSTESATPKVEQFFPASLRPYTVMGQRYVPVSTDTAMEQTGMASWYGKQFHGNKTAIGETYDMHAMSAAHPTMPLPSYAKVTNLENGRQVIVRVNDRGPFLHNRIIDLSYAAATALGYAQKGTAKVRVVRLTNQDISSGLWQIPASPDADTPNSTQTPPVDTNVPLSAPIGSGWCVQIGFFTEYGNAVKYAAHAEAVLAVRSNPQAVRLIKDNNGYRVVIGHGLSLNQARLASETYKDLLGTGAFAIAK